MAQQQNLMDQKKLCCSICLDRLEDPATIPCGHSYCMSCIKSHWDEEDQKEIYSCPQCRQTYSLRPVLVKNTMLADLAEELRRTGLQAALADHCYAGPEDVGCDVCTGRKQKALKSCLQCLVSYCMQHLQPHYESPAFEKHKLVNPVKELQENICPRHGKEMTVFCRTDQQCICILCRMDEHKDHSTVLASTERTVKQGELGISRQRIQQRIRNREEDVKELKQEVDAINRSADESVKNSKKMFTQLARLCKNRSSDVKLQIRSRQKTAVSRAVERQQKLQQEITKLRRKDTELEQLSHTEDNTKFLQNYPSLSCLSKSTGSPSINNPQQYFEEVTAVLSEAGDKLQAILSDVQTKLSEPEADVSVPLPEPRTRAEFLQYSCQTTLDPNTAHVRLLLSEENTKATATDEEQLYSFHQDRFTDMFQVLGGECLSGRHYWEVERSGCEVSVAVTYKNISRAGYESAFGNDDKSWALECFNNRYEFRHNCIPTVISGPQSSKIGVYLDHMAGILCFYSVSVTMTLLHRVQATFTQPHYKGLAVFYTNGNVCAAEFSKLE